MITIVQGKDTDGVARALLVDASGRPIVTTPDGGTEVKPPFGGFFLSPSGAYSGQVSNMSLAAGTNTIQLPAIPAGFLCHVSGAAIEYIGTVTTVITAISVVIGGIEARIVTNRTILSGSWYPAVFDAILGAGDYVKGTCTSATLNDDLLLTAFGYLVPIA